MKVVNYSKASELAGVTRQRIYNIKSDIEKGLCKYQFLAYDSEKKRMGIDIDHPDWKYYCDKNKHHMNKKKPLKKQLKSKDNAGVESTSVNQNRLIAAVVESIKQLYDLDEKELDILLKLIEKKYEEG